MLRTQQLKILCPICNKPDGCLVAEDGGACICSRIEEGSVKRVGKSRFRGGFLHITGDFTPKKYEAPVAPEIDWAKRVNQYSDDLYNNRGYFHLLMIEQRISVLHALRFHIGWFDGTLTIPVYGMDRRVCGIQRRQGNKKRYMKWSGMGAFVPLTFFQNCSRTLAVCEGWSDTIAAMMYGFNAIGKVNAFVGDEEVVAFTMAHPTIKRVLLFADNNSDGVGEEGAEDTAKLLRIEHYPTKLVVTPMTDLRDCWLNKMTLREVLDYER